MNWGGRRAGLKPEFSIAKAGNDRAYPTVWLPLIVEALKLETDDYARHDFISAIRGFGEAARPALPVPTDLISQTTGPECEELLITVAIIDPEAAKLLGATKEVLEAVQWLKSTSGPPGLMLPTRMPPPNP